MEAPPKFEKVVLSGGGIKGLMELGAIHYFYENGLYDPEKVHTYAGASIGSVISLLLICGYAPMEIFTRMYTSEKFFDLGSGQSIWNIIEHTGLFPISVFSEKIRELIEEKMGSVPTLGQLKKLTGKTLIAVVTNVTEMRVEYFSPENHPELSSLDAVKMSCNLPLIFQKIMYHGSYYVDGGLLDGFPINQVDDCHTPILGVVVSGTDCSLKETNFIGYLYRLINLPINMITKLRYRNLGDNITLIKMECSNVPILQFSMPSEKKMEMFLQGFEEAKTVDKSEKLVVAGLSSSDGSSDWDWDWNPFKSDSEDSSE